jgi:hypothetical protein
LGAVSTSIPTALAFLCGAACGLTHASNTMNWHILLAKQSNESCTAEPWLLVILVAETLLSFYAS